MDIFTPDEPTTSEPTSEPTTSTTTTPEPTTTSSTTSTTTSEPTIQNTYEVSTEVSTQNTYGIVYPNSRPIYNIPDYYNNMIKVSMGDISVSMSILGYYETSDTINKVLNWYITKLTSMGYYIVEYIPPVKISSPYGVYEYSYVIFEKGDYGIGIWAVRDPIEGRTIYWIGEIFVE
ncbi:MAG TPA: hypothetical protein EYH15_00255 [Methanothermococcus okinawensis]|uniref:Uncharacterized protein n=1 Tax=Methanothermococcus okinawensis TaxID=155863 RepID=A0A832ZB56_9EURY|nr:hypothetical protein [Methanothermococcus okinawensis]